MIDLANLEKYRENNRIEAKKALGGFPHSVWETYSAFANTMGGIILLGVEEHADKSLHAVDLPDPDKLIREFWDTINNQNKVNVNILTNRNVAVETVNGKQIIVITVPRARRYDKPVYIGGNPLSGTYRRNGEGDYKCTKEEVQSMLRDAAEQSQDMRLLENASTEVFDPESVRKYRNRMASSRPGHVWEELDDEDFLYKIGAVGRGSDGHLHPTTAGLLMFGFEYEIVKEFPNYFLDYREEFDENTRWTDRIVSSSGDWSGNLFDFYFRVYNKLTQDVKIPFQIENGTRDDDTLVHIALREALANCLVNADYYGRQGIVIVKSKTKITFSNPGNFRLDIEEAKSGGVSDPRNANLIKIFNLISIGERAGSGIPSIYATWHKLKLPTPTLSEQFEPERTTLTLSTEKTAKSDDKKVAIKRQKAAIKSGDKTAKSGDKKVAITRQKVAIKSGDNATKSDKTVVNNDDNTAKNDKAATKSDDKKVAIKRQKAAIKSGDKTAKSGDKKVAIKSSDNADTIKTSIQKNRIIRYLTDHADAKSSEISKLLEVTLSRVKVILSEMIADDIIVAEGSNRNRRYRLKS